jgi:PIN domain nuclease of toxin-antitoxin system
VGTDLIVLDTHAWVWWALEPKRLSRRARKTIEQAETLGVSAISAWEVALLVLRGHLELDLDLRTWIARALAIERVETLPLDPDVAVDAALLVERGFHRDPVDRIVYATARALGAPLVTKDRRIRGFDRAATVW